MVLSILSKLIRPPALKEQHLKDTQKPSNKKSKIDDATIESIKRQIFVRMYDGESRDKLRRELNKKQLPKKLITEILDFYKQTPEDCRSLKYHLYKGKNYAI